MTITNMELFKKKILENVFDITKKVNYCDICKIEFFEMGLCLSQIKHGFLIYWSQVRIKLVKQHLLLGEFEEW